MALEDSRPVNLEITKMALPITGVASILHRVCAVIIWVGAGFLLFLVNGASGSAVGFAELATQVQGSFVLQFLCWGFLTALGYYCTGGIKHIVQEFGYFEDFAGGKTISWIAILSGVAISVLVGIAIGA